MKKTLQNLAPLLLLALMACGKEQFGGTPQSSSSQANSLTQYEQSTCSSFTLIKPKVDILYIVDNSTSTYYVASDIQNAIKGTVDKISSQFDYRVVGTGLLPIPGDSTPNNDFQYMTNSSDAVDSATAGKKIISSSEFNFFKTTVSGGNAEAGLRRTYEFINANMGSSTSLFRNGAYLLTVLISNGRDTEVETVSPGGNGMTSTNTSTYNARRSSLMSLKASLNSQQFRLFSVTAQSSCQSGWLDSRNSYVKMAKDLYGSSGATDSPSSQDAYDLCGNGLSSIFTAVNNSIQQVTLPHTYQYWPITLSDSSSFDPNSIQVYVSSSSGSAYTLMSSNKYQYYSNSSRSSINTRTLPTPGEPTTARHLIMFTAGNEITYPTCVSVRSTSKTEYFGYFAISQPAQPASIVVRVNGVTVANSTTNGWSYLGNPGTPINIKVAYPNAGDDQPGIMRSGFFIQFNGQGNYYKSGDKVEVSYLGSAI
jgi:hypothetical protein